MSIHKFIILPFLLSLIGIVGTTAQKVPPRFKSELSGSYALGAQVYNSNFLFRPAYAIHYTHNYKLNRYINCGLGTSYMQLDDENFFPLYANILALKSKKDVDKFVRCNFGYALAHSKAINQLENYEMHGGVFFRFGFGRTYPINDKVALSTELSYLYQNAQLKQQSYTATTYTESLDYSFLQLSLGLVLNYRPYEK